MFCSTGFGECLNDEPSRNLAYQYQFSDYPPTLDRRRSANLYMKGPVYQKLPGSAYTADEQCAQTFEHETRRCPYMVSCLRPSSSFTGLRGHELKLFQVCLDARKFFTIRVIDA